LAVQRLAGIHAAVFFGSAVVCSMFRHGADCVGVRRAQAFFIISLFISIPGSQPVSRINVAETANASLDMTAAAVEATPLLSERAGGARSGNDFIHIQTS
jgi:hypothetical protein